MSTTTSLLCESHYDDNDSNILESYMSDEEVKSPSLTLQESVSLYMMHCRLCATIICKNEAIAIFNGETSIADNIAQCLPVIIIPQDKFSKYICETCSGQLELCCDLILKSIESEKFFKHQLEEESKKKEAERKALSASAKNEEMKSCLTRTLNPDGPIICDLCGNKKFSNMETFDIHMVSVHNAPQLGHPELVFTEDGKPQYECSACHEHLDTELLLREHERTHTDLICKSCQQFHSNAQKLQRHICPDSKSVISRCIHCGTKFDTSFELKIHIQEFHSDNDDWREDRGEVPSPVSILPDANDSETDDKSKLKYQCKKCYRSFMNAGNLARHMITHEDNVVCDICSRRFISYGAMLKHRREHSADASAHDAGDNSSSDNCYLCGKIFSKHVQLVKHLEVEHKVPRNKISPWCCRFCNKRVSSKMSLSIHERIHTGLRPYVCKSCGTAFRSKANLMQHEPVHTGAKKYQCGVCFKPFSRKSFVTTHMRVHTGDRPFACNICPARFTQVGDMRRHVKTHETRREYASRIKAREKSDKKPIPTELETKNDENTKVPVELIEVHFPDDLVVKLRSMNSVEQELAES